MSSDTPSVNIGEAFAIFSEEPAWLKKSAIVGLCMLIPLVGPFQLMGYGHRCYDHSRAGNKGMPDPSLGDDIGRGFFMWFKTIGNLLPLLVVVMTVFFGCAFGPDMVAIGGQAAAGNEDTGGIAAVIMMLGVFAGYGFLLIASLFIGILSIDMNRRLYNGETFPLFSPGATIGAIKRSPGAFVMAWLGMMLAGLVGALGVILCYVGALVTLPLSMAIRTHVLGQWDRVVQANMPGEVQY